jgi:hypothetical protein
MTSRQIGLVSFLPLALLACSNDRLSLGTNDDVLSSAVCPSGNLNVTTQAEIDALTGCTVIEGSLAIKGTPGDGLSLAPLGSLRLITGALEIEGVDALDGLEALEQAGNLWLRELGASSLQPLSSLSRVIWDPPGSGDGGVISIYDSPHLTNLSGLEQLSSWQALRLSGLERLESVAQLSGPPFVDEIILYDLPALTDVTLSFARTVGWVNVEGTGIRGLDGFSLATTESLSLSNNPALESLDGLSRLLIASELSVTDNPSLQRVELPSLEQVLAVRFINNASLPEIPLYETSSFSAFSIGDEPLVRLSVQSYEVSGNAQLARITLPETFTNVQQVAILGNPLLVTLDLNDLNRVDGLTISENPALTQLLANSLERVGDLEVVNNPALSTVPFAEVQTFSSSMRGNLDGPLTLQPGAAPATPAEPVTPEPATPEPATPAPPASEPSPAEPPPAQ